MKELLMSLDLMYSTQTTKHIFFFMYPKPIGFSFIVKLVVICFHPFLFNFIQVCYVPFVTYM